MRSYITNNSFLLLLITVPVWAQSVAINLPADGVTLQAADLTNGRELSVTSTVVEGGANHVYKTCLTANGKVTTPEPCSYVAPWTVKAYPGFWGDGAVDYVVTTYDINGAVLATSPKHTATTRLTGTANSMTASGTSGDITISSNNWNGYNAGGGCAGALYIDGFPLPSGASPYATSTTCSSVGVNANGFHTPRWPNGNHELHFAIQSIGAGGAVTDPFVPSNSFTSANIAGSPVTITLAQPVFLVTNRPIFFTGVAGATNGAFWGTATSTSSPSNLIVSDICTSGACTATMNSSPGVSMGATVDIRDAYLSGIGEKPACEGPLTVTGASGNTLTYAAPGCPDGTMTIGTGEGSGTLSIVTNAYYAKRVTDTTWQVSTTPGGASISGITCAATCTVAGRVANGYWKLNPANSAWNNTPVAFARKVVDFENGHTAMDYWPAFTEVNGIVGQTGPSLCGTIVYTDGLSPTTPTCSTITHTVVDDGGVTGAVTVNSTTGIPTFVKAGWAKVTASLSPYPDKTTYIHICPTACPQPSFTHDGHVATSYTPGQSFIPTSMWNFDLCQMTASCTGDPNAYPMYFAPLMRDSGINTSFSGVNIPGVNLANPASTSCGSIPAARETQLFNILNQWNLYAEIGMEPFQIPTVPIGGFLSNAGFDRQTCAKNALAWLKATGRVVHLTGEDEITSNTGHVNPDCTGVVGTPCFTNITRIGSTATVHAPIFNITEAVWNQANGTGAAFLIKGAPTNTCLNGWQYLTRKTTTGSYTPDFDFTTACTGATTTYDSTSDPGLTIQYLGVNPTNTVGGVYWIHACQLPKYVGNNGPNYIYQGWTSVNDGNGQSTADTSLSSLTSNGSLLTIVDNGNLWTDGQSIAIQGASTAALNGLHVIHVVNANTATTPTTAASGSYTSITDPNLLISSDCNLPTDSYAQLHTIFHAGADIAHLNTIIGGSYAVPQTVQSWYAPTVSDSIMTYHPQGCNIVYGNDCPVYKSQLDNQNYTLNTRAYQSALRANLNSSVKIYEKQHPGYLFDPALDNPIAQQYLDRPETQVGGIMTDLTFGIVSERVYTLRTRNSDEYNNTAVGGQSGSGIGPEYGKLWASIAYAFQAMQHLDRYILQPHAASPYFGRMYNTLQTTSSYGNMLMVVCLLDGGTTESRTVDLTGIRLAGGSIYRMSVSGYRLRFDALAGNPTSDTYTMCGAGAGEAVAYIAQPSGAVSDLTPTTFAPPSPLPYGATKYGIRVGYYPGDMNDDPVTDCTAGCTINLHRAGGPAWFQIIYANNSWTPLATGDPTMLAGQGN